MTADQGQDECALAVRHVRLIKEARQYGLKADLLEAIPGHKGGAYIPALVSIQGHDPKSFIHTWQGSIQWICESPYRPHHKRKNWFVGVEALTPFEEQTLFDEKALKFDTMRASVPGGQHVKTTDSAVRVLYLLTGLTAVRHEERSQHRNKKLAFSAFGLAF